MDPGSAEQVLQERLRADGMTGAALEEFLRLYRQYRGGGVGEIPWDEIEALRPEDLIESEALASRFAAAGRRNLGRLVWIVLNGGLGTSMEMARAKSLLPVKGSLSFLDLLARFTLSARQRWQVPLPLLLMHSFATRTDSLAALAGYPLVATGELPLDFLQHRFPRIREGDGLPYREPADLDAWAPPGHGNLYLALAVSGILEHLLAAGFRWAFVSNADNLGASPDPALLGCLAERGLDFALELTDKTAADVKGGTVVRRRGRLELLEVAQVPGARLEEFQDPARFPVFNTNNLWLDLESLQRELATTGLELPLIVNRKVAAGVPVVQLETAMGAAIGLFRRTAGIRVSRNRFAPVKTTDDLLVRRSDAYVVGSHTPLEPNPQRDADLGPPLVRLDPRFYRSATALEERIPHPPSLVAAQGLEVVGDVRFGRDVVVRGDVRLQNSGPDPLRIADGTVLSG